MADSSHSANESESELSEDSLSQDDQNFGPLEQATQAGADLQVPHKADIFRKRKIQTNPGNVECGKWGLKDPKLVSAWDRVKERTFDCC